jgi:hypothetical protein
MVLRAGSQARPLANRRLTRILQFGYPYSPIRTLWRMRFMRHTHNSAGQEDGGSVSTLVDDESTTYDDADEADARPDEGARELAMEWHAVEERILTLVAELHTLQLEAGRLGITPGWDERSAT